MKQYLDLLRQILDTGTKTTDRTGTGTISVFGAQARFPLKDGFPLLTTKKMFVKGIIHELLWFIRGVQVPGCGVNIGYLKEHGVTIWDEWASDDGDLGRVYGAQWRDWMGVDPKTGEVTHTDQLKDVIARLIAKPDDRRLIVTAWQPAEIAGMGLPPCHCLFQFKAYPLTTEERLEHTSACFSASMLDIDQKLDELNVPKHKLHLQLYQRSCDTFLGVSYNIASYALLLQMVAQVVNMVPGDFIHTYGDLHLYLNHLDQARLQLTREPRPLPRMVINPLVKSIDQFTYEDFKLEGYNPYPGIKADVSV